MVVEVFVENKNPTKNHIFMWCVLENKEPTWGNLQKRCFQGPGWCALCKVEGEFVTHIFVHCPFIKEVWREFQKVVGLVIRYCKHGRTGGGQNHRNH